MRFKSLFAAVVLLMSALSPAATAGVQTLTIARLTGAVKITIAGSPLTVRAGEKLNTPAQIETGADGFVRIEQASGSLDIGPNSVVLVPGASTSSVAERIIQNLGRVLYSVKPRKSRSFSVETPYLVSVVKGTVFSVSIEDNATAVSLLEGSIELVADDLEPVLLRPNESARRGANDRSIDVTRIDPTPPAMPPQARAASGTAQSADAGENPNDLGRIDGAIASELNEAIAAYRDPSATRPSPAPEPNPNTPELPTPQPEAPAPIPETPTPTPEPETPTPEPEPPAPEPEPETQTPEPEPTPEPPVEPLPTPDGDGDDGDCGRRKCDSEDDHDNGRGNDDDDD